MIARHAENVVTRRFQSLKKPACFLELLGLGALGEVAGNDDQVGPGFVDPFLDRSHQLLVVRAEVEIGKMGNAGHGSKNAAQLQSLRWPSMLEAEWTVPKPTPAPATSANGCA